MDVVYILGHGSLSADEEIKYSVRSLERNMLDLGAIYVVGSKSKYLPWVKHISAYDEYPEKWKNMLYKVRLACEDEQITDEFLLMNDDFFMLEPFHGSEYPFYRAKRGDGGPNGMYSFQLHCPMRINKEWFLQMPLSLDMSGTYSPRSFYANFFRAPATPGEDCILRVGEGVKSFDEQVAGRDCFSIGDTLMTDKDFRMWLDQLFPEASRVEAT